MADAERMGFPAEVMDELAAAEPQGFEVWPGNAVVTDTWLSISTQWRTEALADGRVHWLGLDYSAVRAGLDLAGLTVEPRNWALLQTMERTASAALNGVKGPIDDA
jgi:hypothetical protein